MSGTQKHFTINLNYGLSDENRIDPATGIRATYGHVTRNLINIAFQTNYAQGMDAETSRQWKSIRDTIDTAIDAGEGYIILSLSDFNCIYSEIYACKFAPAQGMITPILFDELDIVKNRTQAENDKIFEELEENRIKAVN
tara:strand:- start:1361 stop:1780 length:420 start_codon:yes stop_codon:yes gene_type:complete